MEDKHQIQVIEQSGLFDADWYQEQYPDVRQTSLSAVQHYLKYGWKMGRSPSAQFCGKSYEAENTDVKQRAENPLLHYLRFGRQEGRKPFPVQPAVRSVQAERNTPVNFVNKAMSEGEGSPLAQLAETQKLLEKYFNRCEQLEYQLLDAKRQA